MYFIHLYYQLSQESSLNILIISSSFNILSLLLPHFAQEVKRTASFQMYEILIFLNSLYFTCFIKKIFFINAFLDIF